VLFFLYINKEPVKQIDYISTISSNMTIQLEATGYFIGPPYNTATSTISPTICKGFISIGGYDLFTVAVDPQIIPLGSLLYIDSLGFGMAADIGTLFKVGKKKS
jgi:3D (Asp-Asp-Asp) domain-containing protein